MLNRVLVVVPLGVAVIVITASKLSAQGGEPRVFTPSQAESAGIRTLAGRTITIYTDVPTSPEVDRLPALFDAAVPLWAAYFGIDEAKTAKWQARGYLIGDRRRFESLGLMPPGHANFVNGISMGAELWLVDQPTDYYRRHLLLHEGTHVFMASFLGGCGPGWYMEGMAELFATHRLEDPTGQLTVRIMPASRNEVPMLGRVKLIHDAVAAGRPLSFEQVMKIDNREQLGNESYAWCWAAAKFLDSHPRYHARFHDFSKQVLDPKFDDRVRRELKDDWPDLVAEWRAYVAMLDYGYDFERGAVSFHAGKSFRAGDYLRVEIAADRSWQSTGVRLEAGATYHISASGRYQIALEEQEGTSRPWPCEPGGITIEYHDGLPLGMLLGAIHGERTAADPQSATFERPMAIGTQAIVKPTASGILFLRVNDSPAKLADNAGSLIVTIERP